MNFHNSDTSSIEVKYAAYTPVFPAVKEFWKSVKIWRNYRQKRVSRFWNTVYYRPCCFHDRPEHTRRLSSDWLRKAACASGPTDKQDKRRFSSGDVAFTYARHAGLWADLKSFVSRSCASQRAQTSQSHCKTSRQAGSRLTKKPAVCGMCKLSPRAGHSSTKTRRGVRLRSPNFLYKIRHQFP